MMNRLPFAALLVACSSARAQVPAALKPPDNQVLLLKTRGKGQQIYKCGAKAGDATQFEWTLARPEAALLDEQGSTIGKHYQGPTWEAADGSKVVGQVEQRANSPISSAVPWLLLKAKSTEGSGAFSHVTYIQRLDTRGGAAPSQGCDQSHQGAESSVDYQADYYFYVAR